MDTALSLDSQHLLSSSGVGIRRILVQRLFGQFNYNLEDHFAPPAVASRVILLYGDNGAGKTTILRMLFHLLSHIDNKGHKGQLKRIRFKKFEIDLADGTQIIAERDDDQRAAYDVRILRSGVPVANASYGTEPDAPDRNASGKALREYYERKQSHDDEHANLLNVLKSLNLGMIYLTDKRDIFATDPNVVPEDSHEEFELAAGRVRSLKATRHQEQSVLARAVEQISSWATRQALKGSAQGEEDVNSVYASIIERLAVAPARATDHQVDIESIIATLQDLEERSIDFARFGLLKPLKVKEIIGGIRRMGPDARETVVGILQPYVTGIKARLDALDPIRIQLSGFVDTMNSFYRNKMIRLDVNHGMIISSSNGEKLSPNMLSSGEGQLLFLLASTLVAKERSSLFMIDEPELSLNVKWQRQLIKSLLDLTRGSNVQFVFATHSIELLTRYSEFVIDLENTPAP